MPTIMIIIGGGINSICGGVTMMDRRR